MDDADPFGGQERPRALEIDNSVSKLVTCCDENMPQTEQINAHHARQNIVASAVISVGPIISAGILASSPGASLAQSRHVDVRLITGSDRVYTDAEKNC